MSKPVHTVVQGKGSTGYSQQDRVTILNLAQLSYPAGNGDPATIGAGTPGLGYTSIPSVAFANAGSGASVTAVANMGVVATPIVAAGGSGGTNGTQTVTGTTGTGTKFQASVTVAGGAITAVLSVTVAGVYTAMPTTLAAEPVTGASLSGATLNLTGCMGVVSYTVSAGSSNHQYAQSTTATLTGGSPTTPAVPGAVTVTPVAGQGSIINVTGLVLPANYSVLPGDVGIGGDCYITNRSSTGFTVNVAPASSSQTLAAGHVDIVVIH